jgi:hypothetical protein
MNDTGNTTGRSGFAKEDETMRIWAKIWKDNHMLRDTVIEDNSDETRTHKVLGALYEACLEFDLGKPIWLDANISEFKKTRRVHFRKDSFIEEIDFDSLELMVIEED